MKKEVGWVINNSVEAGSVDLLVGDIDPSITTLYVLVEYLIINTIDDYPKISQKLEHNAQEVAGALLLKLIDPDMQTQTIYELWYPDNQVAE